MSELYQQTQIKSQIYHQEQHFSSDVMNFSFLFSLRSFSILCAYHSHWIQHAACNENGVRHTFIQNESEKRKKKKRKKRDMFWDRSLLFYFAGFSLLFLSHFSTTTVHLFLWDGNRFRSVYVSSAQLMIWFTSHHRNRLQHVMCFIFLLLLQPWLFHSLFNLLQFFEYLDRFYRCVWAIFACTM